LQYKPALTKNFKKEFRKLPKNIQQRILQAIEKTRSNPYAGTKLHRELKGLWRWRVGKYRIIYMIDEEQKLIVFLDVGPRKPYTNSINLFLNAK